MAAPPRAVLDPATGRPTLAAVLEDVRRLMARRRLGSYSLPCRRLRAARRGGDARRRTFATFARATTPSELGELVWSHELGVRPGKRRVIERRSVGWSLIGFGVAGLAGLALNLIIRTRTTRQLLGQFNLLLAVFIIGGQVGSMGMHGSVLAAMMNTDGGGTLRALPGDAW